MTRVIIPLLNDIKLWPKETLIRDFIEIGIFQGRKLANGPTYLILPKWNAYFNNLAPAFGCQN